MYPVVVAAPAQDDDTGVDGLDGMLFEILQPFGVRSIVPGALSDQATGPPGPLLHRRPRGATQYPRIALRIPNPL